MKVRIHWSHGDQSDFKDIEADTLELLLHLAEDEIRAREPDEWWSDPVEGGENMGKLTKELKPGDKVKFLYGHPWADEIGKYIETRMTPVGELHVFEVLGTSGWTAGAKPSQYVRV